MKLLRIIFFVLICNSAYSQWKLNSKGWSNNLWMTSDGVGYCYTTFRYNSPHAPYEHNFYKTTDDWKSSTQKYHLEFYNIDLSYVTNRVREMSFKNDTFGLILSDATIASTSSSCVSWKYFYLNGGPLGTTQTLLYSFLRPDFGYVLFGSRINWPLVRFSNKDTLYNSLYKVTSFNKLHFINDSTGFLFITDTLGVYKVLRTDNSGASFTNPISSSNYKQLDISFPSEKVGYISCHGGKVYKTIDAGMSWTMITLPSNQSMNVIAFMNDSVGFVAGDAGIIYKTINAGLTWQQTASGITNSIVKLWHFKNDVAYALSSTGELIKNKAAVNIEITGPNDIMFFPNPTEEEIQLVYPEAYQNSTLFIFNTLGEKIHEETLTGSSTEINLSQAPAGIYYLKVIGINELFTKKIIKTYSK